MAAETPECCALLGRQLLPGLPFLKGFTPKSPRFCCSQPCAQTTKLLGLHCAVLSPRTAFSTGWLCFLPFSPLLCSYPEGSGGSWAGRSCCLLFGWDIRWCCTIPITPQCTEEGRARTCFLHAVSFPLLTGGQWVQQMAAHADLSLELRCRSCCPAGGAAFGLRQIGMGHPVPRR